MRFNQRLINCTLKLFKLLGSIVLWFVFLFWGFEATEKFLSRPISSSIRFITGDDNKGGYNLPAITICIQNYQDFAVERLRQANKCEFLLQDDPKSFEDVIENCMDWSDGQKTTTGKLYVSI